MHPFREAFPDLPAFLAQVRRRPGMYIGGQRVTSLHEVLVGIQYAEDFHDIPEAERFGGFDWAGFEAWVDAEFNWERLSVRSFTLADIIAREPAAAWALWFHWYDRFTGAADRRETPTSVAAGVVDQRELVVVGITLKSLGLPEIDALLANRRADAANMLGCTIPDDYPLDTMPLTMRRDQLLADKSHQPWLLRAIVEHESRQMIGHIGFHTPPRPEYLAGVAPDAVELGYTIHAPFRRRGFATTAALALMHWAYATHDQRAFLLSISPDNVASTAMAKKLGFEPCGSHIDEEDGLEIEYVRRFETWPADWRALEWPTR